ncbi:hypothetical protein GH714_027783 [Hevea brasiliensis]|uniref:DDE Tnp4 domain-containing protein n=1 Tax=Hevea brasiliensis TaxID=3981 RepID=A0A6A6MHP3_HEVBR|nr:hypothetical protein GH714_027783 [Hevea brasiliensis]
MSKLTCLDRATGPNLQKRTIVDFPSVGGERSSSCYQFPVEDSDSQLQENCTSLHLQLFSSSPEDNSPPKLASSRKYLSSDSSNPSEGRSLSLSPLVAQRLFPLKSTAETVKSEKMSISRGVNANVEGSKTRGCVLPLEPFKGNIRLCKSWGTWISPELIAVSIGSCWIHCTYMGGYTSKEVTGSTSPSAMYDEINVKGFKIHVSSSSILGRCFIEAENGFKSNSFPVIIADATICKELRLLESEFDEEAKDADNFSEKQAQCFHRPTSREEVLHFLNELGWLFQQRKVSSMFELSDYSRSRFKFLLIFSFERDYCTGRRCRKIVDLLIHYSINSSDVSSKKYIFPPSLAGPSGIISLHLAASTSGSNNLIDALTNDPQEIGLSCWNSLLDPNCQSPHAYAIVTNNQSYNTLVEHKLANRRNGKVSVTIGNDVGQPSSSRMTSNFQQGRSSCAKCKTVAARYDKRVLGSQGLLQRPYVHSMLTITIVYVCVDMATKNKGAGRVAWSSEQFNLFVKICVRGTNLGKRNGGGWGDKGYIWLQNELRQVGVEYTKEQLRHKWDWMKDQWKMWKALKGNETELGWDPIKGTVVAPDEWWNEKIKETQQFNTANHVEENINAESNFDDDLNEMMNAGFGSGDMNVVQRMIWDDDDDEVWQTTTYAVDIICSYYLSYIHKEPCMDSFHTGFVWLQEIMREKVGMFLYVLALGASNRQVQEKFQHSVETVSRNFHEVLKAMLCLSIDMIKPIDPMFSNIPPEVLNDDRYMPHFKDCIGAIDVTHVSACVQEENLIRFIGRKGVPTQNIMVACSFDMQFTFVMAGWEGIAHDGRLFQYAINKQNLNFSKPPPGKYYVVDAGYQQMEGYFAP